MNKTKKDSKIQKIKKFVSKHKCKICFGLGIGAAVGGYVAYEKVFGSKPEIENIESKFEWLFDKEDIEYPLRLSIDSVLEKDNAVSIKEEFFFNKDKLNDFYKDLMNVADAAKIELGK